MKLRLATSLGVGVFFVSCAGSWGIGVILTPSVVLRCLTSVVRSEDAGSTAAVLQFAYVADSRLVKGAG